MAFATSRPEKEALVDAVRTNGNGSIAAVQPSQNRFVSEFLDSSSDRISELRRIHDELASERTAWMQSGVVDTLAKMLSELFPPNMISNLDNVRTMLMANLYGGSFYGPQEKVNNIVNRTLLPQFKPSDRKIFTQVDELMAEHQKNYRDAIAQEIDKRDEIVDELVSRFVSFLASDMKNLSYFHDFLTNPEFEGMRQQHKAFLEAIDLQRRRGGGSDFFTSLRDVIINAATAEVRPDMFAAFVDHIASKSANNGTKGTLEHRHILDWLALLSHPMESIDPERVTSLINSTGIFPSNLKSEYEQFLKSTVTSYIDRMKNEMPNYSEERTSPSMTFDVKTSFARDYAGKKVRGVRDATPVISKIETVEVPPKPIYAMLLHGSEESSEETLDRFIVAAAGKISPNDARVVLDVRAIVESLRDEPYGLGVGKTRFTITSPYSERKVPLWHYRADKRPTVEFEHEHSWRLRALFYFDNQMPNSVILESVLHHDDFDRRYGISRRSGS